MVSPSQSSDFERFLAEKEVSNSYERKGFELSGDECLIDLPPSPCTAMGLLVALSALLELPTDFQLSW
jgi:hypothetical protein